MTIFLVAVCLAWAFKPFHDYKIEIKLTSPSLEFIPSWDKKEIKRLLNLSLDRDSQVSHCKKNAF